MAQLTLIDDGDARPDDEVDDVREDERAQVRLAGWMIDATPEVIERALRALDAGVELQTAIAGMGQP
jgi:hypothetical protein